MVAEQTALYVDPESETGKLLALVTERPLRLVSGGKRYRLEAEPNEPERLVVDETAVRDDPFANDDPERTAAAWRATFGVWKGLDTEALKAELKEQRGQDTPGRPGE